MEELSSLAEDLFDVSERRPDDFSDARPEASVVMRSIPQDIELDLPLPSSDGEVVKLRLAIAIEASPEEQAAALVQSVMDAVEASPEEQAAAFVQSVMDAVMAQDFATPRDNASRAELDAAASLLQSAALARGTGVELVLSLPSTDGEDVKLSLML